MKAHFLRVMKSALLSCFSLAVLALMASTVNAYTVSITNDSGAGNASVHLYIAKLFTASEFGSATIPNGQSYTFSTGALCSAFLTGKILTSEGYLEIPRMGCAGLIEGGSAGGPCCFKIRFKIQKKDDGAYHFIKY